MPTPPGGERHEGTGHRVGPRRGLEGDADGGAAGAMARRSSTPLLRATTAASSRAGSRYRIQELAYGGLKPETVRRLEQLGEQLDGGDIVVRRRRADERPIAGTRLLREYQGVEHAVGAAGRLRVAGPTLQVAVGDRAGNYGHALERADLLRLEEPPGHGMKKPVVRKLRCAIYTRKSTEEGLDKAFNSLDAQREPAAPSSPAASRGLGRAGRPVRRRRVLRRQARTARLEAPRRRHRGGPRRRRRRLQGGPLQPRAHGFARLARCSTAMASPSLASPSHSTRPPAWAG